MVYLSKKEEVGHQINIFQNYFSISDLFLAVDTILLVAVSKTNALIHSQKTITTINTSIIF